MKVSRLGTLALGLLLCGSVLAQQRGPHNIVKNSSHDRRTKQIDMTGSISRDANRFVEGRTLRVYVVKNLEMIKGYEGQEVTVRVNTAVDRSVIQLLSIKRKVSYTANWGDSAFRR